MRVLSHFFLWRLGLARAETQTTEEERRCLARYAAGRRRVVEIGVWHGVTTKLLRAVMSPEGAIFAVDPFQVGRLGFSAQRHIALREVASVRNGTVHWLRLLGADAARAYRLAGVGEVDFLFIDGNHTYEGVRADWEAWSPLIAPGGIVALHDSRSTPDRNIDDAGSVIFTGDVVLQDRRFELVEPVDSLTVVRRKA